MLAEDTVPLPFPLPLLLPRPLPLTACLYLPLLLPLPLPLRLQDSHGLLFPGAAAAHSVRIKAGKASSHTT